MDSALGPERWGKLPLADQTGKMRFLERVPNKSAWRGSRPNNVAAA